MGVVPVAGSFGRARAGCTWPDTTSVIPLAAVDPAAILAVSLVGPLITYLVATRRFSGKISSSDATELWRESKEIRDWGTSRIAELNATVGTLEQRITKCERQNDVLLRENDELRRQIRLQASIIEDCRAEVVRLKEALRLSQLRVGELKGHS